MLSTARLGWLSLRKRAAHEHVEALPLPLLLLLLPCRLRLFNRGRYCARASNTYATAVLSPGSLALLRALWKNSD